MNWFYIIPWGWALLYLVEIFLLCMATRVCCYLEGRECVLKEEFSRYGSPSLRKLAIYGWFPPVAIAGIVAGIVVILVPVWKALIKERSFENRKS